jgi:hypothetical protein
MAVSELNPNHPVTTEVREHWHKIAALLLFKLNIKSVIISPEDIEYMGSVLADGAIVCHEHDGILEIKLVNGREAKRLAREEGGLPV